MDKKGGKSHSTSGFNTVWNPIRVNGVFANTDFYITRVMHVPRAKAGDLPTFSICIQ